MTPVEHRAAAYGKIGIVFGVRFVFGPAMGGLVFERCSRILHIWRGTRGLDVLSWNSDHGILGMIRSSDRSQLTEFALDAGRRFLSECCRIGSVEHMVAMRLQAVALAVLVMLCAGRAYGFVLVLDPPSTKRAPVADGIVDRYLLNPRGKVDGLLLEDGTQLHVTLRAAEDLKKAIQPGDHVRIHGRRTADLPIIKPDVIVNVTDGTSFRVPYRLDLPMPPREEAPAINEMRAAGTIEVLLYDDLKDIVNGALLSDGTQIRLPPDVGEHFHTSLEPSMDVEVRGHGTTTPYGSVMEATAIGRKGQPLTHLDASTQQLR